MLFPRHSPHPLPFPHRGKEACPPLPVVGEGPEVRVQVEWASDLPAGYSEQNRMGLLEQSKIQSEQNLPAFSLTAIYVIPSSSDA